MSDDVTADNGATPPFADSPGNGRRAAKSPSAFRTISEVADELNLPQHVLRFWESKFSQIRPLKRGGGRRYYRPEDVDLLRRVRRLLYTEGYTIKGVQKVLRENGARVAVETPTQRNERVARPDDAPLPVSLPAVTSPVNTLVAVERQQLEQLLAELSELRDLMARGRR